jgi:hypothetical protein
MPLRVAANLYLIANAGAWGSKAFSVGFVGPQWGGTGRSRQAGFGQKRTYAAPPPQNPRNIQLQLV